MPDDHMPPDLPELYTLGSIEQVRVGADELRIRILDLLIQQRMTVTELGKTLGIAPAKAHYHVRELERVGLVKLVETRERGGILEKYFRAVARNFAVSKSLLQATPPDETLAAIGEHLQALSQAFLKAFSRIITSNVPEESFSELSSTLLWATNDEMRELHRRIEELFDPYLASRSGEGVRPRMVIRLGYDATPDDDRDEPFADSHMGERPLPPLSADASPDTSPDAPARPPKPHRVFVAGAFTYTRDQLESVVARSEVLDMHVIGFCAFADDISADLVDRAITRFRLRGALSASPEVRAVLRHKEPRKEQPSKTAE